ncbi:hypothetical protein, partial [Parafrankia sp. BMG5.11]|uniref:hypothetical protein n=1 Tax=Parafrankia sp. BMG5.11 TaxID=222540 RepID=UPI001A9CE015
FTYDTVLPMECSPACCGFSRLARNPLAPSSHATERAIILIKQKGPPVVPPANEIVAADSLSLSFRRGSGPGSSGIGEQSIASTSYAFEVFFRIG